MYLDQGGSVIKGIIIHDTLLFSSRACVKEKIISLLHAIVLHSTFSYKMLVTLFHHHNQEINVSNFSKYYAFPTYIINPLTNVVLKVMIDFNENWVA